MATRSKSRKTRKSGRGPQMVFVRRNYVLLIAGVAMIVIGYIIMRVDNQVDGFISLYVAPLIILGGYLEIIYAILWRPQAAKGPAVRSGSPNGPGGSN